MRGEEEINLYYRIIGKDAHLKSAIGGDGPIDVIQQFNQGRKHLLLESLRVLEEAEDWDNIYNLCHQALSKNGADGKPSFLAFDMRVWKLFVKAASLRSDIEGCVLCFVCLVLPHIISNIHLRAFTALQNILHRFVSIQDGIAPMYKKNIGLALLDLTFRSPPSLLPSSSGPGRPSARVVQLLLFIDQNLLQRATFDDVKHYVADLTFEEAKCFIDNLVKTLSGPVSTAIPPSTAHTLMHIFCRLQMSKGVSSLEHWKSDFSICSPPVPKHSSVFPYWANQQKNN